jgi:hypothetical protein
VNGTGSTVSAEQENVYRGWQAMRVDYNNVDHPHYSEVARTLWSDDWTVFSVKALSLWFHGDANNDAGSGERLYVTIQDTTGKREVADHPDPNAVLSDAWQEWNIDLREFSDTGLDLARIDKIYIGVGDREDPKPGGTGSLCFDDIMVFPPRCVTSFPQRGADLNGNCVIDHFDLEILTDEWLTQGDALGGDVDGNDKINFVDYAAMAEAWHSEKERWP